MGEAEKKVCERIWLDRFRATVGLRFEIDDQREKRDNPDFLIRFEGRIVGVEITSLQLDQDKGPSKGSALQAEFNLQREVISRAQKQYIAGKNRPINALVYFQTRRRKSLRSVDRRELARSIVESLRQIKLDPLEQRRLDRNSVPAVPAPVGFLYARGLPTDVRPRWQAVAPGWSKEFKPADVESVLAKKNGLIGQYRQTVAENWLLIVADGRYPPGMFRAPECNHTDLPASKFDRTFLLCEPDQFLIEWPGGS